MNKQTQQTAAARREAQQPKPPGVAEPVAEQQWVTPAAEVLGAPPPWVSFLMQHISNEVNGVEARLGGRIDGIEGRIDGLEGRIDGLEGRIEGIGSKIDAVQIEARAGEARLEGKIEALKSEIKASEARLMGEIKDAESRTVVEIKDLETRMVKAMNGQIWRVVMVIVAVLGLMTTIAFAVFRYLSG